MPEPASYPRAVRVIGWALASLMLLYPAEAAWLVYSLQDEMAAQRVDTAGAGVAFDLRVMIAHPSIYGWAGMMATVLALSWLSGCTAAWMLWRRSHRPLASPSRRVLLAVLWVTGIVFATHFLLREAFGILLGLDGGFLARAVADA